ncbi:unnamed protein product [Closterium sp. NIES-65]|nr:unnamed protein product [Closterium sp. NIES-65]
MTGKGEWAGGKRHEIGWGRRGGAADGAVDCGGDVDDGAAGDGAEGRGAMNGTRGTKRFFQSGGAAANALRAKRADSFPLSSLSRISMSLTAATPEDGDFLPLPPCHRSPPLSLTSLPPLSTPLPPIPATALHPSPSQPCHRSPPLPFAPPRLQILKNAALLRTNQGAALGILSWLGFATGFLGNMLLLSYFTAKRELSACLVQVVGAASTAVLLSQVYLAGFMPSPAFTAVAAYLLLGCAVNCLRFTRRLPQPLWDTWQDVIGVLGLAVLPQVIWSTFSSVSTKLPGTVSAVGGLLFIAAMRRGLVGQRWRDRWQLLSGWTATLLFMVMPVAQLQVCFTRPDQLAGMSALSSLLGIVGNGLMVPRALFTRDFIWFLGCSWGCILMGWGVLLAMALHGFYSPRLFMAVSLALIGYLAAVFKFDADAHSLLSHSIYNNPLRNLTFIGGNPVNQALRELDNDSLGVPEVVVEEYPDAIKIVATVPGLEKKDLQVQVRGKDVVTISGKRTREERDNDDSNRVVKEFSSFERSFRLPRDVSTKQVTAAARNGVLTVTVPKRTSCKQTSGRRLANPNAKGKAKDVQKQGGLSGEQRVSKKRKVIHFAPGS